MDRPNGNRFSVYTCEEKTVLGVINELAQENIQVAKEIEVINKAIEGKTDLYGDHKGSWQGLSKPTLSEEGMRATVEGIIANKLIINVLQPIGEFTPLVNDGITDNTEFLQKILNDENVYEVIFPNGTYKFTNINFNNKKIIGQGNSILLSDGVINVGDNSKIENITFKSITVNKNEKGHYNNCGILTLVKNAKNVEISNCKGIGLNIFLENSHNCIIKNNDIEIGHAVYNGNGTRGGVHLVNSTYNIIENNKLHDGMGDGVVVTDGSNFNKVRFNECFNNGFTGVFTAYSFGLTIEGNVCYGHYAYDGLDINLPADIQTCETSYNVKIINNICYDNHLDGILVLGSNALISGNMCYNNGMHGIATGQRSNDTTLNNNVICTNNICYDNCLGDNIPSDRQANIWLDKVKSCVCSGNQCSQSNKKINYMIYIYGEKLAIMGNVVRGNYVDTYPIKWLGTDIQVSCNIGNPQ